MKHITMYTFSGTGNTNKVVETLTKVFTASKIEINNKGIKDLKYPDKGADIIGIAFPVNANTVSPFIWKLLKALPNGKGQKIFMLFTHNNNAPITDSLKRLLIRKNYNIIGIQDFLMPNNMVRGDFNADDDVKRKNDAELKAVQFAEAIIRGSIIRIEKKSGSKFISFINRTFSFPWKVMRKLFILKVDTNLCNKCGTCAEHCPVNNIDKKSDFKHGRACEFCMRCLSSCKMKAISIPAQKTINVRRFEKP